MTTSTFKNPIVSGFAPDPSVVLVDGIFYLVNSSFHLFPGLPIYASKDLKDWSHIGNAIDRPDQISLAKATTDGFRLPGDRTLVAAGGLYAPTIRHRNGVFYIVCTNVHSDGIHMSMQNFIITTRDIWSDNWSKPIPFDFQGIDPSLFFDDDGRSYIQGSWHAGPLLNPMCMIRQVEIDVTTGQALSEVKDIWEGFLVQGDVEGPHIYKKDGYHYLIVAEGGTWENHTVAIARSTMGIWGPYKSYDANPLLGPDRKDKHVRNAGHGELFQDSEGNWWAAVLGIRYGNLGRSPLGRETFLTPVTWPERGWPTIQQPRIEFEHGPVAMSQGQQIDKLPRTSLKNVHIRDPCLSDYAISLPGRQITLVPREADLCSSAGTISFLGQRQRSLDCTVTATLRFNDVAAAQAVGQAGLSLFKDELRHVCLCYDFGTSSVRLSHTNSIKPSPKSTIDGPKTSILGQEQVPNTECSALQFKIQASPDQYTFFYRKADSEADWTVLGSVDSMVMTADDFTGTIFGIFASTSSRSAEGKLEPGTDKVKGLSKAVFEDFGILST